MPSLHDLILSRFGGIVVRLYRFQLQGAIWRFAKADRDIVAGGVTYRAAHMDRDDIKQTNEPAKDKLKIRFAYLRDPDAPLDEIPSTQDFGDLWHPYIPSDAVQVACLDWMIGASTPPKQVWSGFVAQPSFTDAELELTCIPSIAIGESKNQGAKNQYACWKVPYSTGLSGCNLDPADFLVPGTITDIDGLTITVPEFASAPFDLLQGEFRWPRTITAHNGDIEIIERRTITKVDGADVTLLYGGLGLSNGLDVDGLPGCPGTWEACAARRPDPNNHYGGDPNKPRKNPYDGQSMSWDA